MVEYRGLNGFFPSTYSVQRRLHKRRLHKKRLAEIPKRQVLRQLRTTEIRNNVSGIDFELTLHNFPLAGGGNCKVTKPKYGPANKIGTGNKPDLLKCCLLCE